MARTERKNYFGMDVNVITKEKFICYTDLFGKVYISTKGVNNLSENGLKTVIMHERFHQKINKSRVGVAINLVAWVFMVLSLLGIVVMLLNVLLAPEATSKDFGGIIVFYIAYLFLFGLCGLSIYYRRLQERAADLYSAKEVGKNNFVAGFKELQDKFPDRERKINMAKHPFYYITHGKVNDRIKFVEEL